MAASRIYHILPVDALVLIDYPVGYPAQKILREIGQSAVMRLRR
jgi:hypothetical protein